METRVEGANLPFIDILIFAVIAVLLVLRLRSVLGQRTGYEETAGQKGKREFCRQAKCADPLSKERLINLQKYLEAGLMFCAVLTVNLMKKNSFKGQQRRLT